MTDSTRRAAAAPQTIVFDLDGVLTRRDTLTALILRGASRRPWRFFRLVGPLITFARHGGDFARRKVAVQRIVDVVFTGMDDGELNDLCLSVGRRAASSRWWTRPALVAEYRRLQVAGHPIVVATATEERVAHGLLDDLGLSAVAVLGSRIDTTGGTAALAVYNYGPRKLESLHEAGQAIVDAVFYTDSSSDLPTAAEAQCVVLVDPSRETLTAFDDAGLTTTVFPSSRDGISG